MSGEQLGQLVSAVASIFVPLAAGAVGYVLWNAKRRRVRQERMAAARAQRREREQREERERRDSNDQERGKMLLAREADLERLRKGTIEELEETVQRIRVERNEWRVRALDAEKVADEAMEDSANVRSLANTERLQQALHVKHLERESEHLRQLRRDLWHYAEAVFARAEELRDECALVVRAIPKEVRDRFPDFGIASLRVVEKPPDHLRPEALPGPPAPAAPPEEGDE